MFRRQQHLVVFLRSLAGLALASSILVVPYSSLRAQENSDAAAVETPARAPERAQAEDSARQRLSNKQRASKSGKRAQTESEPVPVAKKPLELEALKDDPTPVKPQDWQSKLGDGLAAIGIAGFWNGVGVSGPVAQLIATILLPLLLLFALRQILRVVLRFTVRQAIGSSKKVVYADEGHNTTIMFTDEQPAPKAKPPSRPAANTERMEPVFAGAGQSAPSRQAMPANVRTSSGGNTVGNFAPSNSQELAEKAEKAANALLSPAERAQKASAAASAAAKAALAGGNRPSEDYGTIPANFNTAGFLRKARIYFIRLQISWDKSDIQNIAEITTPEICEEFRRQIVARGPTDNMTDVVAFEAEVLGVKAVGQKFVVTVKMQGIIKESMNTAQEAFEEIWQLTRSVAGKENWLLADIKQY